MTVTGNYEMIALLKQTTKSENMKPQRIEGTKDYSYKGCVIGKYENGNGATRWMVMKDNVELTNTDFTLLQNAQNYIDVYVK